MAISRESIDLRAVYDGVEHGSHHWTARWKIPDGEDPDDWAYHISRAAIYDRLLEPLPEGAAFNAGMDDRTVVVNASVPEESAPQNPADRDAIGAEVVGEVQGMIGMFGVPYDPDHDV